VVDAEGGAIERERYLSSFNITSSAVPLRKKTSIRLDSDH